MAQRLIVPVDGSETSWVAVDVAVSLARRIDAIVHVVEVAFAPRDNPSAEERLERGVAARRAAGVEIETEVRLSGDTVASAIDELVTIHEGAVVVMASHGRGRSAAMVGSVTEDILQRTFGPIMLVGPNITVDDFSGPIVAAVDGSKESEAALPLAAAWAIELDVEPWIVNVAGPDGMSLEGGDIVDTVYPARLARDLARLSGHRVEFEELHEGHPSIAVPGFAERMGASLIVASSHGRSGLSRLTMGSVTSGFVRHATCPVLVIRLPMRSAHWDQAVARAWAR
jgi:nucleotide-binding universal stress UspA family protein